MDFLDKINKKNGKTVVMVTHDLHLVKHADRVIYLKDGRVERVVHNKNRQRIAR